MIPIYTPINRNSDALYYVTRSLIEKCQHLAAFNHVVSCTLPSDSAKCTFHVFNVTLYRNFEESC